jgi:hypothetical protein
MIREIAAFLHRNLVVCLGVVVLPAKWIIVRLCRDREAEAVAVLTFPEDLCYVVLGLVMGDVINDVGAFHKYFAGFPYTSMALFVIGAWGLFIAIAIHILGQWSTRHFHGWRAAEKSQILDIEPKPGHPRIPNADENFETLAFRHMFLFLVGYLIELGLIFPWLHWIAAVISSA